MSCIRSRGPAGVGIAIAAIVAFAPAATAQAQSQARNLSSYGARVGFSLDPDQLTLGGYGVIPEIAPNVAFRPSADIGFGDDVLTLIGNADAQYMFTDVRGRAVPFFGAGVALLWYDVDNRGSDTEVGVNIYGGVEVEMSGYKTGVIELRVGLDDQTPDFKVTYGFGFS